MGLDKPRSADTGNRVGVSFYTPNIGHPVTSSARLAKSVVFAKRRHAVKALRAGAHP
jgi:hypothetical protein